MGRVPLHYDRPIQLQIVLAWVVPLLFGSLLGVVLGVSKDGYTLLSVVAAIGGLLAGLEHIGALDAASRGVAGGTLFGAGILLAHAIAGTKAKATLPHPHVVLIVFTALFGAILGAIGGVVRERHERRTAPA